MLKTEIAQALKDAFPDIQDPERFEHVADNVIELLIPIVREGLVKAIKEYNNWEGEQSTSDI